MGEGLSVRELKWYSDFFSNNVLILLRIVLKKETSVVCLFWFGFLCLKKTPSPRGLAVLGMTRPYPPFV